MNVAYPPVGAPEFAQVAASRVFTVAVPGRAWLVAVSTVPGELGLPVAQSRRRSRGFAYLYVGVTAEQAYGLASHLERLGRVFGAQRGNRAAGRACANAADRVRAQLEAEVRVWALLDAP